MWQLKIISYFNIYEIIVRYLLKFITIIYQIKKLFSSPLLYLVFYTQIFVLTKFDMQNLLNNLINKAHEKGQRLTYRDETKDFEQILRQQNEITIYQRNLWFLVTELYKIVNGIAPPTMNPFFQFRCNTCNIKNFQDIFTGNRKNIKYCTETVTYRAPFLWVNLHIKHKSASPLMDLNKKW